MNKTKHFKRTAFNLSAKSMVSLMLLLIAMLMPQGAWAGACAYTPGCASIEDMGVHYNGTDGNYNGSANNEVVASLKFNYWLDIFNYDGDNGYWGKDLTMKIDGQTLTFYSDYACTTKVSTDYSTVLQGVWGVFGDSDEDHTIGKNKSGSGNKAYFKTSSGLKGYINIYNYYAASDKWTTMKVEVFIYDLYGHKVSVCGTYKRSGKSDIAYDYVFYLGGCPRPKNVSTSRNTTTKQVTVSWQKETYSIPASDATGETRVKAYNVIDNGNWGVYRNDDFTTSIQTVGNTTMSAADDGTNVAKATCSSSPYTYNVCYEPKATYGSNGTSLTGSETHLRGLSGSSSITLNHVWGEASWKWDDDGHSATCTRACTQCSQGDASKTYVTVTLNNGITAKQQVAPNCTTKGTTRYTATATVAGTKYTSTKDVDIAALGHGSTGYTESYVWTGNAYNDASKDTKACTFTLTCKKCSAKVVDGASLTCTKTAHTDATCTQTGSTTYQATGSYTAANSAYNYSATKTNIYTVAATGIHDYQKELIVNPTENTWGNWESSFINTDYIESKENSIWFGNRSVSASQTVAVDMDNYEPTITVSCDYQIVQSGSKEGEAKITVYWLDGNKNVLGSKLILDWTGKNYSMSSPVTVSKQIDLPAGSHFVKMELRGKDQVDWAGRYGPRFSNMSIKVQPNGVVKKDPTCTQNGEKNYSCLVCGQKKTVEIAALGHSYDADGVCTRDASHYQPATLTSSYYQITNYGNLCWFRNEANSGKTINAKLTVDINLSGKSWATSIGEGTAFGGVFDGQGHTITGNARKALFCVLAAGSTVKNVVSTGATSKDNYDVAGNSYQSPFVRRNYGTIENCIVKSAYWDSRNSYLGGITGVNETGGIVRNCGFYDSTLRLRNSADTQVGGIVGVNCANGRIENCFTWGINYYNIGSLGSGGIVCENRSDAIVSNCYTNVATPVFKQEGTATNLTSSITAAFITTGEMCYKLNGGTTNGSQVWYQKIGTETFPTPVVKNTANTVYKLVHLKCDGKTPNGSVTYTNNFTAQPTVEGHGLAEYTPTYTWGGTYAAATCSFTLKCNQCNSNVMSQNLAPTKVDANHVDATCGKDGNERWTATGSYSKAGDATYNGTAQTWDYAIPATGFHSFDDVTDPYHTLCTVCDHSFFRYTSSTKKAVDPYNADAFKGAGDIKLDYTNTYVDGQGVMEFEGTLKTIGEHAFSYCSNLKGNLIIPNSVTSIGDDAFCRCSGFTGNLTIPNSVTSIGNGAFSGCSGFNGTLTIPNSVTSIGESAFSGCSGFNGTLTIPNSVTSIGIYAFCRCSGFTGNLTIPNSVTSIGESAFSGCSGFNGNLTIPNSVTSIGIYAFDGCSGFTGNLTIPNSVTSIGNRAFYECSGFTGNLTIPNSVTSIGNSAFYNCSGFNGNLTIPNSVTSIGNDAFYGCSRLTGVELNSVPQIGSSTFNSVNCTKAVVLSDDSYVYTGRNPNFPALQSATYTRTSIKNQWGTIVVPFDVENGDEYDFYTLSSLSGDELTLTKVNGRLAAGTPALIRINSELVDGKTYDLTLRAVSLVVNAQGTLTGIPANGLTLTGSYSVKDITGENGYIISNNKFWSIQDVKGSNNVYCAPFRAYIASPVLQANARTLNINVEDGKPTDIDVLNAIIEGDAEFYDMNGRKLNSLQTGVNIVKYNNGKTKKVVIK